MLRKTFSTCDILCQKSGYFSLLLLFSFLIVMAQPKMHFHNFTGHYKCVTLGWRFFPKMKASRKYLSSALAKNI